MNQPKTIRELVQRLKTGKPRDRKSLEKLGIKTRHFHSGSFRIALKVVNLPVIVKVANLEYSNRREFLQHSRTEIRNFKKIQGKKYSKIHAYTPKVYFADRTTGLIAMKQYVKNMYSVDDSVINVCRKVLGKQATSDLHSSNFALDGKQLKIIDLGFGMRK